MKKIRFTVKGSRGQPIHFNIPVAALVVLVCVIGIVVALLVFAAKSWVNVGSGEIAIFVKKTGKNLESGDIIALSEEQKGIQDEILSEGWHFKNYYTWERVPDEAYSKKINIPKGSCGIKVRLFGKELPPGEIIAYDRNMKGVVPGALEPGTYSINRLAYDIILYKAIEVPNGFVGIVHNKSGKIPQDPNQFVVDKGERGIQKQTMSEGTYYINRFEKDIIPIDMRSQIYQLAQLRPDLESQVMQRQTQYTKRMKTRQSKMVGSPIAFPSKDGFQITLEGKIEWKIDPERAAEVYVEYVDNRPVMTCIVEKIILPNTRSFVRVYGSMEEARNFIEGSTRQKFQKKLYTDLRKQCDKQGIIIINVSITEMEPPLKIASLIKGREVAKRLKAKYLKEKEREKQEKTLAMEKKLQGRSRLIKEMEALMSVKKTFAEQQKEVAIVEASKKLSVAKLELEASRKLANAILSQGTAKRDVIGYQNIAASSGIRKAAQAFKSGKGYAKYLFLQKIAPGFVYILANTDGPFIKVFEELFGKEKDDE